MNNYIEFGNSENRNIVFCLVDRTSIISDSWANEIVKNISDYTISNITIKRYNILQGFDENQLLRVASLKYNFGIVLSTGTEFINGTNFFDSVEELIKKDFFIAGHILDRKDAFYELHHQCYIVNLQYYKSLDYPMIGDIHLGKKNFQIEPIRSEENYHDDYTPLWVKPGNEYRSYNHLCHGWNIISTALNNNLPIEIFDNNIRDNKIYYYPEHSNDFYKHFQYISYKEKFCVTEHVHSKNSESTNIFKKTKYDQVVIPASGIGYTDFVSENGTIIFYDYNDKSLEYWKSKYKKENCIIKFVKFDMLGKDLPLSDLLDINNKNTFINLSNIFCYEGTISFSNLRYRIYKENQMLNKIINDLPDSIINFTLRAASGFQELLLTGPANEFKETDIKNIIKPTWRYNTDWL